MSAATPLVVETSGIMVAPDASAGHDRLTDSGSRDATHVGAAQAPAAGKRRLFDARRLGLWPLVLVAVLVLFQEPIEEFIDQMQGLEDEPIGAMRAEIRHVAQSAAAAGFLAGVQRAQQGPVTRQQAQEVSDSIGQSFELGPTVAASAPDSAVVRGSVLWVDDTPADNLAIANAFRDLGIDVVPATSTAEAINRLEQTAFDVIITDTTRDNDDAAAPRLIDTLRKRGLKTPVIVYAADWSLRHQGRPPQQAGARAVTDDVAMIYQLTVREVQAAHHDSPPG